VFDLENKFVAYTGTFTHGVRAVFSAWGNIFILGNDGNVSDIFAYDYSKPISSACQLSCLKEKPTSEKLDMLYRKSLYLLALNLAKTQKLDQSSVVDIYRQYGDHLYAKGDYDGAMQQYVQTIGHLQPSYVIRKVCGTCDIPLILFLIIETVSRRTTHSQPSHVLAGIAFSWSCELGSYHSPLEHVHKTEGRCPAR
jgi:hypothetical protein